METASARLMNGLSAAALVGVLSAGAAVAKAPAAPHDLYGLPNYGTKMIALTWSDVDDVDRKNRYRIYRGTAKGGPYLRVADVGPGILTAIDAGPLDPMEEYFYTVTSFRDVDESPASNECQQNIKTVWPVPSSHEILHTWNETIGAQAGGFHAGVDIQRSAAIGATHTVVAVRGGKIVQWFGTPGNREVCVDTRVGAVIQQHCCLHLTGIPDPVKIGKALYAGQEIGKISFSTKVKWEQFSHTHYSLDNGGFVNPLLVFSSHDDRDPGGNLPAIVDHKQPADGTVLFRYQGAGVGKYLDYNHLTKPLGDVQGTLKDEGNVDIHVELGDEMGTNPDQVPMSVGYWIEGPRPPIQGNDTDDVMSASTPYMLVDWTNTHFAQYVNVSYSDIVDTQQNLKSLYVDQGQIWPWDEIFKFFILTNTKGTTGTPADVDESQYWNTNAKNDGSGPGVSSANFAGRPDTRMAHEARFPDGDYTIHLRLTDNVHIVETEMIEGIRIENYPPIIKELQVYEDSDSNRQTPSTGEHAGFETLIYSFQHENPSSYDVGDTFLHLNQKAIVGSPSTNGADRRIWMKVRFSEQMHKEWKKFRLAVDPRGAAAPAAENLHSLVWKTTYVTDDTVVGQLTVPAGQSWHSSDTIRSGSDYSEDAVILVTARDLQNRLGHHRGMDADSDGTPEGDSSDRNHKFKIGN